MAAKPADFQERIWLVQILMYSGRQSEAEKVIREAVNLSRSDPDRWIMLVKFLADTRQLAEAAKAVKDAEASLPPLEAPWLGPSAVRSWDGLTRGPTTAQRRAGIPSASMVRQGAGGPSQ